jgi:hypothetical protein
MLLQGIQSALVLAVFTTWPCWLSVKGRQVNRGSRPLL